MMFAYSRAHELDSSGGQYNYWYNKSEIDEVLQLWKSSQKARTVNKKEFVKQRDTLVSGRRKV